MDPPPPLIDLDDDAGFLCFPRRASSSRSFFCFRRRKKDSVSISTSTVEEQLEDPCVSTGDPLASLVKQLPDCASLGPIGPLLRQLGSSMEAEQLKGKLRCLYPFLIDLYNMRGSPSYTAKWWMEEFRDLCHEIKDYWDKPQQIPWYSTGFMARLQSLYERGNDSSYLIHYCGSPASTRDVTLHLPMPAATMEDLVELLAFGDHRAKQLRVVTLFGVAGAANTRAARTLYDLYGGRFQCRAFVRVSKYPDMRSVFASILSQIKAPPWDDDGLSYDSATSLIRSINNHLQRKRYLIVIDDVWAIPERNTIMRAFPGGYRHSRVITTTQIKDVALASFDSYLQNIFEMTPLNDDQSGTPERLKEEVEHIYNKLSTELKTCLLYLNMYQAGYTIRKDDLVKQWIAECFLPAAGTRQQERRARDHFDELVRKVLIQPVERNCNDEVMSCTVEHMVLDMIANKCKEVDFITSVSTLENTGLLNEARRLSIQLRGEVDAKIPENLVLAKVRSLAFSGFPGCVPSLVECSLVQVLILDIWADRGEGTFDLSGISGLVRLRYVKIRCNITVRLPDKIGVIESLKTLEVDAKIGNNVPSEITFPECLLHLRIPPSSHLHTNIYLLPFLRAFGCFDVSRYGEPYIMHLLSLEFLEDLHLTCSAPHGADMQQKMDVMWSCIFSGDWRSLRSVDLVPAGSNHAIAAFFNIQDETQDAPTKSLLEQLVLSPRICIFSSIPNRLALLGKLRILKIATREISEKDVHVLGSIPALTALSLYVWTTFAAESSSSNQQENGTPRIRFGEYRFPSLGYFKFTCPSPCLTFRGGAMRGIQRLKLRFNGSTIAKYNLGGAGLEHLTYLEHIAVKIGKDGADESDRQQAEYALESAFTNHSVPPIINIQSVDRIFCADQHQPAEGADSSSAQSESSSHPQNQGEDDVHCAKARRGLLLHIIGHENYKLIQREKEQMITVIEGSMEGPSTDKWILQLQELVYDIEDFIYNLSRLTRILSLAGIIGRMKHLKRRIKTLRNWQHAAQWSQLMSRDSSTVAATSGQVGYQIHPYCYTPESNLIGIDTPKRELARLIEHRSSQDEQQLMVVSIVGCLGLGKSTLARAVYDYIPVKDYDHVAWVVASDCETSGEVLNKISQQFVPQKAGGNYPLSYILLKRRYLLVIDEVQRAEVWHGIEDLFPQSNRGGRIIVTTSIQSVAAAAAATTNSSSIYRMRSLGDDDSKSLFWKKFYDRDTEPAPVMAGDSETILKKCDGLPLSLLSMARYFRQHYRTGRIERFSRLVGGAPEALREMNSALAECYSSLRDNGHRLCLLSLSIFPHGHPINRKSVIRRWVAEGLVAGDGVRNAEQVARDRFDELVDRSIIEPVHIANNSRVKRCRVRGPMLEFIVSKAISRNFVTLIHKDEAFPNKQDHHHIVVRRLSDQDGTEKSGRVAMELGLSVIRSLTSFKRVVIDLHSCKLLRVLDLEGCKGIDDPVLDAVCQLLILRYLSLRGSDVGRIPKRIERLQHLETLDLRETEVEKLPLQVIMLPWLAHLFGKFDLPRELKEGKENSKLHKFLSEKSRLQNLSGFVMGRNSGFESMILDARSLRKVKIWCKRRSSFGSEDMLVSGINRRFNGSRALESMSIEIDTDGSPGFLNSLRAPCKLSSMKLTGQIGKLPDFITSCATTLGELQLSSTGLSSGELSLLQNLPCLLYLKLHEDRWGFGSGDFVIGTNGFLSLERMCFEAPTIPELHVQIGAKTKLASLQLLCPEYPPSRIKGIKYLQHLKEVVLHDSVEASEMQVWTETAMEHENRPRVTNQAGSE